SRRCGARARSRPPPNPLRGRERRRAPRRATGDRGHTRARARACPRGRAWRHAVRAPHRSATARPSRARTPPRRTLPRRSAPLRSAAEEPPAEARRRARPPPRRGSERSEEIDADAVGIAKLRVAVAPERIPRLLLA